MYHNITLDNRDCNEKYKSKQDVIFKTLNIRNAQKTSSVLLSSNIQLKHKHLYFSRQQINNQQINCMFLKTCLKKGKVPSG